MVSNVTRNDPKPQLYVITAHPTATTETSSRIEGTHHFEIEMQSVDIYTSNYSDGESLESGEDDENGSDLEAGQDKQNNDYGI